MRRSAQNNCASLNGAIYKEGLGGIQMKMSFDFYNPTKILFGSGKLNELGSQNMPGKKAMLLMSKGKAPMTALWNSCIVRAWTWLNLPRSWKTRSRKW